MPSSGSDVSVWGGWASQYGRVSVTEKFLLVSSDIPVTVAPSSSTTTAPTVSYRSSYSLSFQVASRGVTTTSLQPELNTLGSVFCAQLIRPSSQCLITFVSSAVEVTDDLQFDLLVTDFTSEDQATAAVVTLEQYLADVTAAGFIEEFVVASGLRFTTAVYQSSSVTQSSSSGDNVYAYSCDLSDHLKLSWRVESQGDGTSVGAAGGLVTGSLTMLTARSTPWFAAGVVTDDSVTMVSSPEHVVYFYEPNSQQAGMYRIDAYSSSGIVADTRLRADTGVVGKHVALTATTIDFQQSRITGRRADAVHMLSCCVCVTWYVYDVCDV